ncbi:MAG: MBG domain-containing protein, partial [Terracidiphilus sp.]
DWIATEDSAIWSSGSLVVAQSNPNVLYMNNDEYWFGNGTVLASTDGGQTWTNAGRPDGVASDAGQLAISPSDPNTVYAVTSLGLYKTTTGGNTWAKVFAPGGPSPGLVAVALSGGSDIFAGSSASGFYRSIDGGASWAQSNSGISAANVVGLEVCRSNPSTIYAAEYATPLMKSMDAGGTWSFVGSVFSNQLMNSVACDPQDDSLVLTSTYPAGAPGDIAWKTTDGGATFHQVLSNYAVLDIAFNPHNPNLVNASTADSSGGYLYSSDAGDTWSVPDNTYMYPGQYAYHPTLPNVVFTTDSQYTGASVGNAYISYSVDSGVTWNSSMSGQGNLTAIALDQTDPTILYSSGSIVSEGSVGIYKYQVSYSGSNIASLTRIPGVFNTGLGSTDIRKLVYDPSSGYLYAATGNGVYRTNNQASSWNSINSGLPFLAVNEIAVSPDGHDVYVGTNGGIFVWSASPTVATATVVTSNANPQTSGASVTFTIGVAPASGSGIPKGTVSFFDGATQLALIELDGTGHASFTTSVLGVGTHTIITNYSGDATYAPSSGSMNEQIVVLVPAAAPTFSLSGGSYTAAQTVSISDTTPGATIYYAINGTPTASSTVYSGPITVSTSETISAIATATGYTTSAVASAAYSIIPVLTVTANNISQVAGMANPAFTASYSGFVNGDTAAVLNGAPAFSTAATASSPAGLYPITVSQGTLSAGNYTFAFVNGTLSLVAAPTVTLTTTATLSGSASAGYTAAITVKNTGMGAADNVQLTTASLGSTTGSPLPANLGTIAAGGTATVTLNFPSSAGSNGAAVAEKYAGSYTGGTFSATIRAVLP